MKVGGRLPSYAILRYHTKPGTNLPHHFFLSSADSLQGELETSLTDIDWLKVVNPIESQFEEEEGENGDDLSTLEKSAADEQRADDVVDVKSECTTESSQGSTNSENEKGKSGSQRPPFSYAYLIALAIADSPDKRITLTELYEWFEKNFPYYRTARKGWKVRSLFNMFNITGAEHMSLDFLVNIWRIAQQGSLSLIEGISCKMEMINLQAGWALQRKEGVKATKG